MTFKNTPHVLSRGIASALLALSAVGSANAGFITTNEAGLDAVYAQAGIDIRFLSALTIYSSTLATIDTNEEMDALGALGSYNANAPVVSAYFLDNINFCGIALPGIAGCAGVPGTFLVIVSAIASGDYNDQLGQFAAINVIGHELGHNLGLNHDETAGNLMTSELQGGFGNLLSYQIDTIFNSQLVRTGASGQRYIEIQPYAVVADVPEPAAYALVLLALGALGLQRKRKAATA